MQTTTNYGLKKPEETDFYDIDEMVNENMDIIDEKLHECFQSVSNGKKLIASAITDKGVATASDATFAVMAENIENIETSPNLQTKTATLDTTKTSVILTPDSGYDGLSNATVSITTQSKSTALSTSAQTIKPDSGKVLSAVSIPAIEGTAAVGDVLAGKTFNSATAGIKKTGTIVNRKGATVDAIAVSQDDTYTYFKTPAGCYSAESMVRTKNSNLTSEKTTRVGFVHNLSAVDTVICQGYVDFTLNNNKTLVIGALTNSGSVNFSSSDYYIKLYFNDGTEKALKQNTTVDISSYTTMRVLLEVYGRSNGASSGSSVYVSYNVPITIS